MDARVVKAKPGQDFDRDKIVKAFELERLDAYEWSSKPGDKFAWHTHEFRKVLYCIRGSIVFHTDTGDHLIEQGDRIEVAPHARHAATAGSSGVVCLEAAAA